MMDRDSDIERFLARRRENHAAEQKSRVDWSSVGDWYLTIAFPIILAIVLAGAIEKTRVYAQLEVAPPAKRIALLERNYLYSFCPDPKTGIDSCVERRTWARSEIEKAKLTLSLTQVPLER